MKTRSCKMVYLVHYFYLKNQIRESITSPQIEFDLYSQLTEPISSILGWPIRSQIINQLWEELL